MLIRIQKILSQAGIASRRHAEALIKGGQVRVNDRLAKLGDRIDPQHDRIFVNDQAIQHTTDRPVQCLLLNKPVGILCTRSDPQGRSTVYDLLPPQFQNFYYVGRLDGDSSGALLLTNSGELAHQLSHPRYHLPKTYQVWVEGILHDRTLDQWRKGVVLEGKLTLPAQIKILQTQSDQSLLEIVLQEGRNRQIRKIATQLGHPVLSLQRKAIGTISLNNLPSRQYRLLSAQEISQLTGLALSLRS